MNFLLISAAVCSAKKVEQIPVSGEPSPVTDEPSPVTDEPSPEPSSCFESPEQFPVGESPIPTEDFFSVAGPVNGVCDSEYNSHPMAFKDFSSSNVVGKWNTVLVDAEMLNRDYVPQCMTAEFFKIDDRDEMVFRVGEMHRLKD